MTARLLASAFLAAMLADAALADGYKSLGHCSRLQVRDYVAQGMSDQEIRDLCEGDGAISCDRQDCSGEAVDTLRSEGFAEDQIQTMCGQPLCPEGQ